MAKIQPQCFEEEHSEQQTRRTDMEKSFTAEKTFIVPLKRNGDESDQVVIHDSTEEVLQRKAIPNANLNINVQ